MKRIMYAGGSILTDDATADALMDYARVLAIVGSADVVELSGVDDEGDVQTMRFVVGPASQLLTMTTDLDEVELDGAATAANLRARAHERLPSSFDVGDTDGPAESDAQSTEH